MAFCASSKPPANNLLHWREHAAALQTRLDQAEAALRSVSSTGADHVQARCCANAARSRCQRHVADERQQLKNATAATNAIGCKSLDNARQDAKQQRANLALSQRERDALAQQLSASQTQAQELKLSLHTTEQQTDHWQARCAQLEAALTQEREQQAAWLAQWAQRLAQQPAEKIRCRDHHSASTWPNRRHTQQPNAAIDQALTTNVRHCGHGWPPQ